ERRTDEPGQPIRAVLLHRDTAYQVRREDRSRRRFDAGSLFNRAGPRKNEVAVSKNVWSEILLWCFTGRHLTPVNCAVFLEIGDPKKTDSGPTVVGLRRVAVLKAMKQLAKCRGLPRRGQAHDGSPAAAESSSPSASISSSAFFRWPTIA